MSINASGKIGERLVFSKRGSGQQARFQRAQKDVITDDRLAQRVAYSLAVAGWNSLDQTDKDDFNLRAKYLHISGYNLYIRENIGVVSYDTDAQNFFDACAGASAPLSGDIKTAVNDFVLNLKSLSLWSKLYALYPFVGGVANSHKFNLKDPRDLDVAFRLVFHGGWTHSANGALSNGSNGYADTFFAPSAHIGSVNSMGFGHYSGTTGKTTSAFGCQNTATNYFVIYPAYTDNLLYCGLADNGTAFSTVGNTSRSGFIGVSRNANGNNRKNYNIRGTSIVKTENANSSLCSVSFYFGANNRGTSISNYIATELRGGYFDSGLSPSELGNLYSAFQSFEIALGRSI